MCDFVHYKTNASADWTYVFITPNCAHWTSALTYWSVFQLVYEVMRAFLCCPSRRWDSNARDSWAHQEVCGREYVCVCWHVWVCVIELRRSSVYACISDHPNSCVNGLTIAIRLSSFAQFPSRGRQFALCRRAADRDDDHTTAALLWPLLSVHPAPGWPICRRRSDAPCSCCWSAWAWSWWCSTGTRAPWSRCRTSARYSSGCRETSELFLFSFRLFFTILNNS